MHDYPLFLLYEFQKDPGYSAGHFIAQHEYLLPDTHIIKFENGLDKGMSEYLGTLKVSGLLTRHKEEKTRALKDANNAFDDHRHWPLDIIISHLGLDPEYIQQ